MNQVGELEQRQIELSVHAQRTATAEAAARQHEQALTSARQRELVPPPLAFAM